MMEEEESYSSSLLEEDEEEEVVSPLEYVQMLESVNERLKEIYKTFPPFPNTNEVGQIAFLVLYAAQYHVLYYSLGGRQAKPTQEDTPEELYEKATFIHLRSLSDRLFRICHELSAQFYVTLEGLITLKGGEDHPLLAALENLNEHVELHTRRTKTDPTSQRNPRDLKNGLRPVINVVTGEEYKATPSKVIDVVDDHVVTEKKAYNRDDCSNWRWLTLHPLPSDSNYRNINPMEGDEAHRMMVQVDQIEGRYECEEPFGFVVTSQWDKLLRLLHTMLHVEEYFANYIVGAVKDEDWDEIDGLPWAEAWKYLVGKEYADKPVEKFSREKKKVPMLVSRIAEMRDLMRESVLIISNLCNL